MSDATKYTPLEARPFLVSVSDTIVNAVFARWAGATGTPLQERADAVRVENIRQIWFEATLTSKWMIAYRIVPTRSTGEPAIGELRIFPAEPGRPQGGDGQWTAEVLGTRAVCPKGGITSRILKTIRLSDIIRPLTAIMTSSLIMGRMQGLPNDLDAISRSERETFAPFRIPENLFPPIKPRRDRPGPGRRPLSDQFVARVVRAFSDATIRGSRTPAADAAAQFAGLTAAYVRVIKQRAIQRGLVSALQTTPRAWALTPKAEALLTDALQRIATGSKTGGHKTPQVRVSTDARAQKGPLMTRNTKRR